MSAASAPGRAADRSARPFRLRRTPHKVALTAHILASVGWFGVAIGVAYCGVAAAATTDPALSAALYRTMSVAVWISVPLGALSLATGTTLSVGTPWGLLRHWWVVAKLAINLAVAITDLAVVDGLAQDAVATGAGPRALYGSTIAHVVVLGVAAVLAVFKPWGRIPLGHKAAV